MTLQDIFNLAADNPIMVIAFFVLIPIIAAIVGWIGAGEGTKSPYSYIYSFLIFLASIPGIFALTMTIYAAIFHNDDLRELNFLVYFLPVISMVATIAIIKRVADLEDIPGFGKIPGLLMSIAAIIVLMLAFDKIMIFGFVRIPFIFLLLIFIGLLLLFTFGMRKFFRS